MQVLWCLKCWQQFISSPAGFRYFFITGHLNVFLAHLQSDLYHLYHLYHLCHLCHLYRGVSFYFYEYTLDLQPQLRYATSHNKRGLPEAIHAYLWLRIELLDVESERTPACLTKWLLLNYFVARLISLMLPTIISSPRPPRKLPSVRHTLTITSS